MEAPKHIDAYPWNCPCCIADPRAGSTDSSGREALLDEHAADVQTLRQIANPSPGLARLLEHRHRTPRHRRHPRAR
jgi:hypothetical protein